MGWARIVGLLSVSMILLAGCKAEMVDIELRRDDVTKAANGEKVFVEFEAKVAAFGELTDELKGQISVIKSVVEKHLEVDDFDVVTNDYGFDVVLEGKLLLTSDEGGGGAPWFVYVGASPIAEPGYWIQFRSGAGDRGPLGGPVSELESGHAVRMIAASG